MRGTSVALVAAFLPLFNALAQSPVRVDESKLRADLKNDATVIVFPLENTSTIGMPVERSAGLTLEWLNHDDFILTSVHRDITIPPGPSRVEIPLAIPDSDIWLRLRYSLTPDRADVRAFPPLSGIVAVSQIAAHIFELKASHIGVARPGQLLTVYVQAIHPITREVVPGVTFDATLTIANAAALPEKTTSSARRPGRLFIPGSRQRR